MKFPLGTILATPAAVALLRSKGISPIDLLIRHASGDWGDVCAQDADANLQAIRSGARILSAYKIGPEKVWIITEADRSSTCILLPSEY
jgi:hypothetical protein